MLIFPLPDGRATLVVVEPGNISRLKAGKPLRIGELMIIFTPDMQKFLNTLGVEIDVNTQPPGAVSAKAVELTPERVDMAHKACRYLPEVER